MCRLKNLHLFWRYLKITEIGRNIRICKGFVEWAAGSPVLTPLDFEVQIKQNDINLSTQFKTFLITA